MNLKGIFALFVSFFLVNGLFAQTEELNNQSEKKVLTIEDAVQLAKENNISIKTAENTLNNLDLKNKYSWNSVSPTANLNGNFSDNLESDSTSFSLSGSVNLNLKTNLYSEIKGAKLNYEKGLLTYKEAVRQIELSVRKSFYNLIYQQENLVLQNRSLETSKTQYLNNEEIFKNGKISELDAFTSRVNYEAKKPVVESAEINFQNDLATFKQILGIPQKTEIELKGSLDEILNLKEISFDLLPKVEEPAPNVKSAEYDVEIAKNSLLDSRFSAYAPSISGTYSYGKSYAKDQKNDGYGWSTTNQISVGVSVPLDGILPWSMRAVTVKTNANALDTAEKKLEDAKTTVAVQTESYIRKINQAVKQIDSLKATEELANQTYQMTLTAYNYGKTDFLSLQNANDSVLSAGVNLKSQAYTLISTILDLESVLGLEFGTLENQK